MFFIRELLYFVTYLLDTSDINYRSGAISVFCSVAVLSSQFDFLLFYLSCEVETLHGFGFCV